jgi:hypothetical protein
MNTKVEGAIEERNKWPYEKDESSEGYSALLMSILFGIALGVVIFLVIPMILCILSSIVKCFKNMCKSKKPKRKKNKKKVVLIPTPRTWRGEKPKKVKMKTNKLQMLQDIDEDV